MNNNPPVFYVNGKFVKQEPPHGQVNDVFCWILLAVMPLQQIVSLISSENMFHILVKNLSLTQVYHLYIQTHRVMNVLGYLLSIAVIVCIIADIVIIYKQNYKITGLILFAVFLMPGYYIWRAYVLGRKKTFPVIYTVCYGILVLGKILFHILAATDGLRSIYWLFV